MATLKDHFLGLVLVIYPTLNFTALEFPYVYVPAFSDSIYRPDLSMV